jgi:hypothetical protein
MDDQVPCWFIGVSCFAVGMAVAMVIEMVLCKYIGEGVK